MNAEAKEQSKQWLCTQSPNKLGKFKQMSARKLLAAVFLGQKSAVGGIHATREHTDVTSIFQNMKNFIEPFITKSVQC
jgi:hypothetical protein